MSGELAAPDDVKFKFKFLDPSLATFPHVRFKDIVFSEDKPRVIAENIASSSPITLTDKEFDKVKDHVDLIRETFFNEAGIVDFCTF